MTYEKTDMENELGKYKTVNKKECGNEKLRDNI